MSHDRGSHRFLKIAVDRVYLRKLPAMFPEGDERSKSGQTKLQPFEEHPPLFFLHGECSPPRSGTGALHSERQS